MREKEQFNKWLAEANKDITEAWLLRKQAEAVEAVAEKFLFKDRRVLTIEAQRLRNKADKLESNQ